MTDLFLSYKAEDRPRVAPLVQALETDGISVWWDEHIGGGDEWRDTILRHLESARVVMVVWSKRSIGPHGQFVRDEASRALRRGTYLPVRIDKVEPPLGFGESQALDLHGWKGDRSDRRYQALLETLRKRLGIEGAPAAASSQSGGLSRRTVIIGTAAVGTAAVAGLGTWLYTRTAGGNNDSIAVLPFANLSGDPNQVYFSDGIAEELRSALSQINGLKVVARTSSEAVRDEDAKEAAHKLGVNNILTGSVRRSPNMIRVSAQLVDGNQGVERWSAVYDRPAIDALQVQTDIANQVVDALSIRLAPDDRKRLEQGGTTNVDAHDLLLKAQSFESQGPDSAALQRVIGMVDAAIALDPNYADAVATKAQLLTMKAGTYSTSAAEYRQGYAVAEQTARHAIQLAPRSRSGYLALAMILDQQLQRRAALQQFQTMASLPGDDAKTLPTYAIVLSELGRGAEALQLTDRSIALDPLNPLSYRLKAAVLVNARRYSDAAAAIGKTIELRPQSKPARSFHAFCEAMMGNTEQARKEFAAAFGDILLAPPGDLASLTAKDHALGDKVLERLKASGEGGLYQMAQIYAQMGKRDEAIASLNRAWEVRDPGLTMMKVDPLVDPVRSDPRFQSLLKSLDFPG